MAEVKTLPNDEAYGLVTGAYARQKTKHSKRNSKYRLLRDLFDNENDAWWSGDPTFNLPVPRGGRRYSLTLNYFAPITMKIAAFIMADKVDLKAVPFSPELEERVSAQKAEKALYAAHKRSKYQKTLNEVALDSAKLGTGWTKAFFDTTTEKTRYIYCDPECVYPEPYKSVFTGRFLYVLYAYEMDLEDARIEYGSNIEAGAISEKDQEEGREADDESAEPKVSVIEYWSDKHYILTVGDLIVENQPNPYGFIPFTPFPLITQPGRVHGKGMGDWIIEANAYYNQAVSQGADAQALNCNPPMKYKNAPINYIEQISKVQDGGVIPINKDGDLDFVTWQGQPPSVEAMLDRILGYIHDVSHIPRVAFGDVMSTNSSRVISVQYDPVVKVMRFIRDNYTVALQSLDEQLLRLMEKYEKSKIIFTGYLEDPQTLKAKRLRGESSEQYEIKGKDIAGHYDTEIIWPGVLPKDDLNAGRFELEKQTTKVQSKWTTMENLGILNPEDEMEILESELANENLYPKEGAAMLGAESRALSAISSAKQAQQSMEMPEMEGEGGMPPGMEGAEGMGGALPRELAGGMVQGVPPGPEAEPTEPEALERSYEQMYSE